MRVFVFVCYTCAQSSTRRRFQNECFKGFRIDESMIDGVVIKGVRSIEDVGRVESRYSLKGTFDWVEDLCVEIRDWLRRLIRLGMTFLLLRF